MLDGARKETSGSKRAGRGGSVDKEPKVKKDRKDPVARWRERHTKGPVGTVFQHLMKKGPLDQGCPS